MTVALLVPGGVDTRSGHVLPYLVCLIERLARRHQVHVFSLFHGSEPAAWTLDGAQVHNIGSRRGWRRRLYRTFAAVHAQTPIDVLHAFWGSQGLHAAWLGWRHRLPVVTQCLGGEFVADAPSRYGAQLTWRGRASMRVACLGARRVLAQSEYMARLGASLGIRVEVVPLGVALDRWPPRAPRPRQPGRPLQLLHIGDLRPVKDQITLLDAAAALQARGVRCDLHVAGVDHLNGRIQQHATALGLAAPTWHGWLDRARLRALVEASDLLVISSRHEAGAVAVLEAAVAGVPTVGTAVGHIADWAPAAAVAVPIGNAAALAREIEALANDEPRRLAIAEAARGRATAQDADYTARRVDAVYAEVTGRHD
jgi:glycosyltransferase involved in cell wall biosynthesis